MVEDRYGSGDMAILFSYAEILVDSVGEQLTFPITSCERRSSKWTTRDWTQLDIDTFPSELDTNSSGTFLDQISIKRCCSGEG